MKLRNILESRKQPFEVTALVYRETDDGEVPVQLVVSGTISQERNPFGTGDSPTEYDVEITKVTTADGTPFDDELSDSDVEKIEAKAIKQYR